MNIDDYDFDKTARAVFIMNETTCERYDTWEDLKSFMISMAYTYGHKTTSFSTGGFQLTFFNGHDGEINCRASVSAYTALRYAERVAKQFDTIRSLAAQGIRVKHYLPLDIWIQQGIIGYWLIEGEVKMTREYTSRMLELLEEGMFDKDALILDLLNYLSESEVKNFVKRNDFYGFRDLGFVSSHEEEDEYIDIDDAA